jgi:aminopeptidase N
VIDERVVRLADALRADESVAAGIRRAVGDEADDLRRALAVRANYPTA